MLDEIAVMAQINEEYHDQLIERLIDGFDALRRQVEVLTIRKMELERLLEDAHINVSL